MTTRAKPKEIVVESQKVYEFVRKATTWISFAIVIITLGIVTIWWWNKPSDTARQATPTAMASIQRVPGDSTLAPIKVELGKWQHVMLLPKERKFLRIDLNTHVEIIGKGVRVLDICADNQARLPRQCPVASPPQQISIENERDETNIILAQAFS